NTIDHTHQTRTQLQLHPRTTETHITQNKTQSRMRWTNEQNEGIMRSYYRVTDLGRNETVYRKRMYDDFISNFPSLAHLTEQRVADQRRAIINNKYISSDKLNSLKAQVAEELLLLNPNSQDNRYTDTQAISNNIPNTQLAHNTVYSIDEPNTQTLDNTEINIIETVPNPEINLERDSSIDETFQQALTHYKNTSPINRSYIPKQKPSKNLARLINYFNKFILPENIDKNTIDHTHQTRTQFQLHPRTTETHITQNKTQSRMRWTNEQNEGIMRSYYRVTDLGRNETVYRKRMYDDFISNFTSLAHLTEQRVADQRRAIINNKYISSDKLNSLKAQVAEELLLLNPNSQDNRYTDTQAISNDIPNTQSAHNMIYSIDEPNTHTLENTEINIIETKTLIVTQTLTHFRLLSIVPHGRLQN
ncbi:hypothetical protein SFRURICE_000062, partial [Spodoptera frugiperda]